jgi:hypothetical protein
MWRIIYFITSITIAQFARKRLTRDETRERIMIKADELFRQFGFLKTMVADIAAELGMSPANIYKFFSSKEAIIQAMNRPTGCEKPWPLAECPLWNSLDRARNWSRFAEKIECKITLATVDYHFNRLALELLLVIFLPGSLHPTLSYRSPIGVGSVPGFVWGQRD